jgi:hypothetical protein
MCVDCVLASPRIAQVDPGDEPLPKVVLSQWWGDEGGTSAITGAEEAPGGGTRVHLRQRRPSVQGGRRPGGARVSSRGGGWAGWADSWSQANSRRRRKFLFEFLLNFGFGRTLGNCTWRF